MKRLASVFFLLFSLSFLLSAQMRVVLPEGTPETLVVHDAYTVSFNDVERVPNYVAYRLRPGDITTEGVSRDGEEFLPDPEIPGCPETREYTRSHYPDGLRLDRGHMMPAADCKTSSVRMRESFYLSNVCPQDHTLNERDWCELEEQVRFWCKHYYKTDLWVVCGPLFGNTYTSTGINIPDGFWKVVCRYDARDGVWRSIGFVFENSPKPQPYAMRSFTVDEVERLTGMDFFADLDDSIEKSMEGSTGRWKF